MRQSIRLVVNSIRVCSYGFLLNCTTVGQAANSMMLRCCVCLPGVWCHVIVAWLFLAVPRVCLQIVIVVFPDHTLLVGFKKVNGSNADNILTYMFLHFSITPRVRL